MKRPALLPRRWGATRHGREPRLLLPIKRAMAVFPFRPILQSGLDALGHRSLAQALAGGTADLHGLGDLGIRPFGSFGAGVRLQEDAGARGGAGRGLPLLDGLLE